MPINIEESNPEQALQEQALQMLERLSEFGSSTTRTYSDQIASLQKERRDLLVYLGSIAGGAAALAPQFFGHVLHPALFYAGILLLVVDVVVALSYVLGHVEIDVGQLGRDQKYNFEKIEALRKPYIDFLNGSSHGLQEYALTHQQHTDAFKNYLAELDARRKENETRYIYKSFPSIKPLNYISEFQIWFFVLGIGLLTLSTLSLAVNLWALVLSAMVLFIVITVLMHYPDRIFVWAGFPIDLCKSYFARNRKGSSEDEIGFDRSS